MQRYAPGDRKFVLGVLELRPCPTLPERARSYVDAFLSAWRELREAQKGMPGLRVDGTQSRASGGGASRPATSNARAKAGWP